MLTVNRQKNEVKLKYCPNAFLDFHYHLMCLILGVVFRRAELGVN